MHTKNETKDNDRFTMRERKKKQIQGDHLKRKSNGVGRNVSFPTK